MSEITELLEEFWDYKIEGIHTALPASIVSYNSSLMTCSIKPLIKVKYIGEIAEEDLPTILDVPVQFPRSSTTLSFEPLQVGDIGIAIFSERSISDWLAGSGNSVFPDDGRTHNLSDAYFIPGGYPGGKLWTQPIPDGASGKSILPGAKIYFGSSLPMATADANKELVSIIRLLAEWMQKMNTAHAGAGTIPVADVTAGIAEVIATLQSYEA